MLVVLAGPPRIAIGTTACSSTRTRDRAIPERLWGTSQAGVLGVRAPRVPHRLPVRGAEARSFLTRTAPICTRASNLGTMVTLRTRLCLSVVRVAGSGFAPVVSA